MELTFNKVNDAYVAEFTAEKDFNLHIERTDAGIISVYQRGSESGDYALVQGFGLDNRYRFVIDTDFTSAVYPKHIKVESVTQPSVAVVTYNV